MSDVDRDGRYDLVRGVRELDDRRDGYVIANSMYEGTQREIFANKRIAAMLGRTGDKFRINFAAVAVDAIADRLEVSAVTASKEAATVQLNEVWDDNQLDLHMPNILKRAGIYGDYYTIVWKDQDETVTIDGNSPLTTIVIYDDENPRVKAFAVKRWPVKINGKDHLRGNVYYADRLEKYLTKTGQRGDKVGDWDVFEVEGEAWPLPNEWDEVPVFHYRNEAPYGVPDHIRAFGPQRGIDKTVAVMAANTDFAGFPQRYGLAASGNTDSADDLYDDDNYEGGNDVATNTGRQPQKSSQLEAHPGKLWILDNLEEVGEFAASNPDAFLKPTEFYIRSMAVTSHTPLHEFDPSGDQPSGESRRTAEMPLVKRVDTRKLWYGATLREQSEFVLAVLGTTGVEVQVSWKASASVDDVDGVNVAKGKQELGVPQEQTLLELGYTPEQMAEWSDEIDEGELRRRVALLRELGAAVQALGAGATLGVIDPAAVRTVMNKYLNLSQGDVDQDGEETIFASDEDAPTEEEAQASLNAAQQAALVQKVYLGVPTVLSADEARDMLRKAGVELAEGPYTPAPEASNGAGAFGR
jgi:hypothetical protein